MRHPVWFTNVLMKYLTTIGMPRNENFPDEYKRLSRDDPNTHQLTRQDSLELGRHQDLPRQVAGHPDDQGHQPARRRAEGDRIRR